MFSLRNRHEDDKYMVVRNDPVGGLHQTSDLGYNFLYVWCRFAIVLVVRACLPQTETSKVIKFILKQKRPTHVGRTL